MHVNRTDGNRPTAIPRVSHGPRSRIEGKPTTFGRTCHGQAAYRLHWHVPKAATRHPEAALEMRDRLMALGLVCFCKTISGEGLHVVTPLAQAKKDRIGWPKAKAFAREVCLEMAAYSPSRYLIGGGRNLRQQITLSVVRQFETDGGLIYGSDRLIWF